MSGSYDPIEIVFIASALAGGTVLAIKFIMLFFGGDASDLTTDVPEDPGAEIDHIDADASLKLVSIHGLSSFFTMFGLVGLALYRSSRTGATVAVLGGTAGGFLAFWLIAKIFSSAAKLQSSGTLDTRNAVGAMGTVYMNIPPDGTGKVMVNFQGRMVEMDARSAKGEALTTGSAVRVVAVTGSLLDVERV